MVQMLTSSPLDSSAPLPKGFGGYFSIFGIFLPGTGNFQNRAQLTNPHDQLSHSHGAVDVDYFVGHPILEINIKFYVKMILSYPFFININIYFEG